MLDSYCLSFFSYNRSLVCVSLDRVNYLIDDLLRDTDPEIMGVYGLVSFEVFCAVEADDMGPLLADDAHGAFEHGLVRLIDHLNVLVSHVTLDQVEYDSALKCRLDRLVVEFETLLHQLVDRHGHGGEQAVEHFPAGEGRGANLDLVALVREGQLANVSSGHGRRLE